MDVRIATKEDADLLVAHINDAYRVEEFCIKGSRTDRDDILQLMEGGFFFVCDRNGGSFSVSAYVTISGKRGYFGMLAVRELDRGKGMGVQMISFIEDYCRTKGCLFLDITVVSVRKELFPFYERLRFAPYDISPFPNPEAMILPLHFVKMCKPLYATSML